MHLVSQFHFLTTPRRLWLLLPVLTLLVLFGWHGEPHVPLVQSEAPAAAIMAPAEPDTIETEAMPHALPWPEVDALDGSARLETGLQRLKARIDANQGLLIHSTREQDAEERGAPLRVVADVVGRADGTAAAILRHGPVVVDGERVRWERPGLTEEYSVSVDGLRQDFLLAEPPAGRGELRLELAVAGARAHQADDGAHLQLSNGRKLTYSRLHVEDANGQVLPARMEVVAAERIVLTVNDADAVYPLRIDPTFNDESGWAQNFWGANGVSINFVSSITDRAGNTYLVGNFFSEQVILGSIILTRIGSEDVVVAKVDATGTVLWAQNFGGVGASAYGSAITIDDSGHIYLGGHFTTADLTTPALTKLGTRDAFALQLDADGNLGWARNFGGSGATATFYSVTVDSSGHIYLGGNFNTADLTTPALTMLGGSDAFALQLDADGNMGWARNFGGSGATASVSGIAADSSGHIYLGGYFIGADLTTPALTKLGNMDAFALQLDALGNVAWARNFGGSGAHVYGNTITVDGSGHIYLAGHFGAADLTTPTLTRLGDSDAFALQLDADGNLGWAQNFGGSGANASVRGIAVDNSGHIYLGGYFNTADLTTPALTKLGSSDAFALQLDADGHLGWAQNFGGSGANAGVRGIAVDGSGHVYLGGYFNAADLTTPALTRLGVQDAFAIRLDALGNVAWARNIGGLSSGGGNVVLQAVAVDGDGNSYVVGSFSSKGLMLGSITLTRIGSTDAVVAKVDAAGTVLWAQNFGGIGATAYGKAVAVDSGGRVYLSGDFFDADLTAPALTRLGNTDAFALQLDVDGNLGWARNFGGSGATAYGTGIAIDSSGHIYLSGYFFDADLTAPALTRLGGSDAFALQLDADGNLGWARNFGGSGANTAGRGIAVDGSGHVYLGGFFNAADLTTPALTRLGNTDAFALQLDADGNLGWAQNFGASGATTYGTGIAADSSDHIYLGGFFNTADLTTPALTRLGTTDAFALQLDVDGSLGWAQNFGGSGAHVYGNAITVDGSGHVYLGGYFNTADLTTPALTKLGTTDAFALQLDADGNLGWAQNFGGSGATTYGTGIAVDSSGHVYLGGYFNTADLTTPALALSSADSTDGILFSRRSRGTVTPIAGENGSISPATAQFIDIGSSTIFTVTPAENYRIASIDGTCGGTLEGDTYTTNVITGSCTVEASFALNSYTVTAAAGEGGGISPASQSVNHGSTASFIVTPNDGYSIASVNGCAGNLSGSTYTTGPITGACAVTASFTLNSYTVTATAGEGGDISPASQSVNHGSTASFTVTSDDGYTIIMGGSCGGSLSGSTYATAAVTAACTVKAQFEPIFSLEDGDGQALGDQELLAGDSLIFNLTNGSGNYDVMAGANANGVSGTLQNNGDGSYSFIAPSTGAFAGDYLITVTDTVSGWTEQLTISVPLKVSLSRSTLLSRGERNTAVVTVTGAEAGQAVTLSVAGDELSLLPQSDDTGMVAAADPDNGNPATGSVIAQHSGAAVGFDVVASVGGYLQGQVSGQVLPAIAYAGSVSSPIATPIAALVELRITVDGNTSTLRDELDEPFTVTADDTGSFLLYGPDDDGDYSLRFSAENHAAHSIIAGECRVHEPCLIMLDYATTVATPELSQAPGSYAGRVAVGITTTTVGATLIYTLDGSTPSRNYGEVIENDTVIHLTESATLKVMAWKDGLNDSEVVVAEYVITATGGGGGAIDPAWLLFTLALVVCIRAAASNAVMPFATRCNARHWNWERLITAPPAPPPIPRCAPPRRGAAAGPVRLRWSRWR